MSTTRKPKSGKRERAKTGAAEAYYVYAVGESAALLPLFTPAEIEALPEAIEAGTHLELVTRDDLAAIVSRVPLADYGEEALTARLADAGWTATRAMRHEGVVAHFSRRVGVVPLRFGTIYLARENVAALFGERAPELRAVIARVRGRDEWGVNVYCDRAELMKSVEQLSPRLRELTAQVRAAPPGQAYLLRKKIEALRADEARAEIKRRVAEIEGALAERAGGVARLRALKDEGAAGEEAVARFAFLVGREHFAEFQEAAERMAVAHLEAGLRLELTGPWPCYNFAAPA